MTASGARRRGVCNLPADEPVPYRLTARAWRALAATTANNPAATVRAPVRTRTATTQTGSTS